MSRKLESLVFGLNAVGKARLAGDDEERGRNDLERCVAIAREAGFGGFVAAGLANLGCGHDAKCSEQILCYSSTSRLCREKTYRGEHR